MTNNALNQLAHSKLLPSSESAAILLGTTPPLADLIQHLVIGSMDAEALTAGDNTSTWTQRRMSRQLLALTFLAALVLETLEPDPHGRSQNSTAQEGKA